MTNIEFGLYLKSLRENLNYSTYDVNKKCNISQSYLSLIENGKRNASANTLKKLASVYKVDYLDLYEKAGYIYKFDTSKIVDNLNINVPSNAKGISSIIELLDGLDEKDLEDVKDYINFIKSKKK